MYILSSSTCQVLVVLPKIGRENRPAPDKVEMSIGSRTHFGFIRDSRACSSSSMNLRLYEFSDVFSLPSNGQRVCTATPTAADL